MTGRAFGGPGRYIQQAGEIDRLPHHVAPLGSRPLLLIDGVLVERLGAALVDGFRTAGLVPELVPFGGECTLAEIERIAAIGRQTGSEVVVGIGGGKSSDAAKAAAHRIGARTVVVPTIASTDAPCSAIAVRYTAEGVWERSERLPFNPDLVVVDSAIVAAAPPRFLVAGMGDAIATWYEARSVRESGSLTYVGAGFPATAAGMAVARETRAVLLRDGVAARDDVVAGRLTDAVENVIEANILLSSIGFENGGCAAAHGLHGGLTLLEETHGALHGEKIAVGLIVQLVLERRPETELREVLDFLRAVGLPATLEELGVTGDLGRAAEVVAAASLAEGESTRASPVELSVSIVRDAIVEADRIARRSPPREP